MRVYGIICGLWWRKVSWGVGQRKWIAQSDTSKSFQGRSVLQEGQGFVTVIFFGYPIQLLYLLQLRVPRARFLTSSKKRVGLSSGSYYFGKWSFSSYWTPFLLVSRTEVCNCIMFFFLIQPKKLTNKNVLSTLPYKSSNDSFPWQPWTHSYAGRTMKTIVAYGKFDFCSFWDSFCLRWFRGGLDFSERALEVSFNWVDWTEKWTERRSVNFQWESFGSEERSWRKTNYSSQPGGRARSPFVMTHEYWRHKQKAIAPCSQEKLWWRNPFNGTWIIATNHCVMRTHIWYQEHNWWNVFRAFKFLQKVNI